MKWFLSAALIAAAAIPILGVFAAITWFASDWVVSSLVTVTVIGWLASWLVVAYGRGRARAAAIGAVVAGAAYWLLALGPWFQTNIGSTLLTSRLLTWVETTHRQPGPQQVTVFTTLDLNTGGYVANNTVISGSGIITTQPQYVLTTIPQPVPVQPPGMSHFQSAGHWSFAWFFALAGGILSVLLQRRSALSVAQGKEATP